MDERNNGRKAKRSYLVQVDIIPDYLPPYLPAQAMALEDVDRSHLPFVGPLDVLAYKVHCSSMRSSLDKQNQDARDAVTLWQTFYAAKTRRHRFGSGSDGGIFQVVLDEKVEVETMV
ncbi:hypothetical protein KXV69_005330 [Aspergillus fumigatus]|nr:hypothetical protein KXV69_005330 [Aspergillus fumigatus]